MTAIPIRDPDHWHELRRQHVGGSEVAALFGQHPFNSLFQLYHLKRGTLPAPDETERMAWGQYLEPAVAKGIADRTGWSVRKIHQYYSHDEIRGMGASLDYEIVANERGPGVLQIKTHDRYYVSQWQGGEPPLYEELQLQHEIELRGTQWGALGILVGGNELRIVDRARHQPTIDLIKHAIPEFWRRVEQEDEPDPDAAIDRQAILKVYGTEESGETVDFSDDPSFAELVHWMEFARQQLGHYDRAAQAAATEIIYRMGHVTKAVIGDGRYINAPVRKRKGYTVADTKFRVVEIKKETS